jgi:hypothetical protein
VVWNKKGRALAPSSEADCLVEPFGRLSFLFDPMLLGDREWLAGIRYFEQQGVDPFLDFAF